MSASQRARRSLEKSHICLTSDRFPTMEQELYEFNACLILLFYWKPISRFIFQAVSGNDAPHNNFFFYDGLESSGLVDHLGVD